MLFGPVVVWMKDSRICVVFIRRFLWRLLLFTKINNAKKNTKRQKQISHLSKFVSVWHRRRLHLMFNSLHKTFLVVDINLHGQKHPYIILIPFTTTMVELIKYVIFYNNWYLSLYTTTIVARFSACRRLVFYNPFGLGEDYWTRLVIVQEFFFLNS